MSINPPGRAISILHRTKSTKMASQVLMEVRRVDGRGDKREVYPEGVRPGDDINKMAFLSIEDPVSYTHLTLPTKA